MSRRSPHGGTDPLLLPVLVAVSLVVSILSSLGAPLIPDVAESLDVSLSSAQWSLTAALLAGAVGAPILGRLGDGPRRREAILGTLVVVFVGSLVAGFARDLPLLLLGRTMQGVGLALAPIAMAAAREGLPAERVPGAIGLLSVSGAAGVGAGYPISGLIASQLDVHAAFLFGAVISALVFIPAYLVIPSSAATSSRPLDLPGALLGAVGLVALLIGIAQGAAWGWTSGAVLGCFALAIVVFTVWVRQQLRKAVPLIDLRQLRHRAVLGGDLAALMIAVSLYTFLSVVTEFVQVPTEEGFGFGASTMTAGLCLVPFSVLSLGVSRFVGPLTRLIGTRALIVIGCCWIAAAGTFFALVHSALWQPFVTMGLLGVGFGLTFAAIPGIIARAVPAADLGSAMGFYQVIRSVGFSVGSAMVASALAANELAGSAIPGEQGYVTAAWIGVAVCLVAALAAALFTPPERPGAGVLSDEYVREDAELASAGLIDTGLEPPPTR